MSRIFFARTMELIGRNTSIKMTPASVEGPRICHRKIIAMTMMIGDDHMKLRKMQQSWHFCTSTDIRFTISPTVALRLDAGDSVIAFTHKINTAMAYKLHFTSSKKSTNSQLKMWKWKHCGISENHKLWESALEIQQSLKYPLNNLGDPVPEKYRLTHSVIR